MSTEPDWHRLGNAVRRRRERLGLTQQEVAGRGGPSTATMRQIEGALTEGYRAKTLYALDEALGWFRGTCIGILEGEPPHVVLTPFDDWVERTIRDVSQQVQAGQDFPVGKPALSVVPGRVDDPEVEEEDNEVLAAIRRDPDLDDSARLHFLNQYVLLRDLTRLKKSGELLPYVAHGKRADPVDPAEEAAIEERTRAAVRENPDSPHRDK